MAHERIEIDLPLAKAYELLSNPVEFPKFLERIDVVNRINSQTVSRCFEGARFGANGSFEKAV